MRDGVQQKTCKGMYVSATYQPVAASTELEVAVMNCTDDVETALSLQRRIQAIQQTWHAWLSLQPGFKDRLSGARS